MKTEPVHTARLILRSMTPDDAENVWSIWGQVDTGKYLADEYYKDANTLRALFFDVDDWPDYSFVAFSRETNEFMGTCSIGPEGGPMEWGFGYCVVKKHWGKGYATEMARALMDFACQKGIRDFRCTVAIENTASGRVMQKCGLRMDHESSFKKRGTDIVYPSHIYTLHLD
jgi:RimJ/RimL family protein N-acetyltransferase